MTSLPLIASRLFNTPLMVNPQKAAALIDGLGGRILGCDVVVAGADPVHHVAAEQGRPSLARLGDPFGRRLDENGVDSLFRVGAVAIIGVEGSLTHKGKFLGSFSGQTSYEGIQTRVRQAMDDPSVRGVVFEVDSYGGELAGAFDTAALIRQLSAVKPTIAILTDYALSAGYLLASGARQIAMPESGRVGSIGVVVLHSDYSRAIEKTGVRVTVLSAGRHKAEGNPYEPLPDDVAKRIRADLEQSRLLFAQAVAEGRGNRLTVKAALATEADDFSGADALKLGLVDAVGHPNELFDEFVSNIKIGRVTGLSKTGLNTMMNSAAQAAVSAAVTETFASVKTGKPESHTTVDAKTEDRIKEILAKRTPERPQAHMPDIVALTTKAPIDVEQSKYESGADAARALLHGPTITSPDEILKYRQGADAARTLLFGPIVASAAELAKYEQGAAAARTLLAPVAGPASEMSKYTEGATAARALLAKTLVGDAEKKKYEEGAAAARAVLK